jgi:hypothetical protein
MIDNPFIMAVTVILLIVSLLAGSCGPKTRTITPLSEADRSGIKKVAIQVQVNDDLEARISRTKERYFSGSNFSNACYGFGCAIAVILDITFVVVEEAIRSSKHHQKEEEYREDISDIEMDKLISEHIDKNLETSNATFEAEIVEIQSPSILAQKGFDTILEIAIEKIELKLCPKQYVFGYSGKREDGKGPAESVDGKLEQSILRWNEIYPEYFSIVNNPDDRLLYGDNSSNMSEEESEEFEKLKREVNQLRPVIQIYVSGYRMRTWITFKGKITSTRDGSILWEREELYHDPKCEWVVHKQGYPPNLVDMMIRALQDIAVNTVNEIQ